MGNNGGTYMIKIARITLLKPTILEDIQEKHPYFSFEDDVYLCYSILGKECRTFISDKVNLVEVGWSGVGVMLDYSIKQPEEVRQLVENEVFEIH